MKTMQKERAHPRLKGRGAEAYDPPSGCDNGEHTSKTRARLEAKAVRELKHKVAQEVHDHAGQFIAALFVRLNMLDRHVSTTEGHAVIEKMRCDLHQLGLECKRAALIGRPALLEQAGLAHAIVALLNHWAAVANFATEFHCNRPGMRLDAEVELALYRVTQEALTNVAKHAADTPNVSVTLHFDTANWKYLKIEDSGPGFELVDGAARGAQWGLVGMRERLRDIGASLEIISSRGFGTTILAWRPPLVTPRSRYHAGPLSKSATIGA